MLLSDEPHLGNALTTALLGRNPDFEHLQTRIRREIRDRLSAALGAAGEPDVLDALLMLWAGSLVYAGMGYASYTDIADRIDKSARLILAN
jgi:TetR/AcrR family transcriptional regulator, cholesterol catabolism regulator